MTYQRMTTDTLAVALDTLTGDPNPIVDAAVLDRARDELTRRLTGQETLPGFEI